MMNQGVMDNTTTSLCLGVEASNIDMVRCNIDQSIDPTNIRYNDNSTLLHYAVHQNNIEIIEMLLTCTRDVNVVDVHGKTPLLVAVESNSEAYNRNKSSDNTSTCLEQEIERGQKIIEHLLNAGGDLSLADHNGMSPITVAVSSNNVPLIDCLLHRGLSKDPHSFAPILRDSLHLATRLNHQEVVQILVENYSINVDIDHLGVTPLQVAIEMGYTQLVDYLISKGANVQGTVQDIFSREFSEISLKENENIEGKDRSENIPQDKLSPLHTAAQHNQLEIAKLLIQRGADPDNAEQFPYSALYIAVCKGYVDIAELFLRSGADPNERVNYQGKFSCYLMHCAVLSNNIRMINILVENGAKVNLYDKNGNSPLALAVYLHQPPTIDYFLKLGAFTNSLQSKVHPLHLAVANSDAETVSKLLRFGAELEATDEHGKTALYTAVEKNNLPIAQILLTNGANVNAQFNCDDVEAFSPIHVATLNGNVQMVKLLLEKGARCQPETSPIHLAIASGNVEMFEFFWKNRSVIEGPESNIYWSRNNEAIHWAVKHDQVQMVKLLYSLGSNLDVLDKDGYSPLFRAMLRQNNKMVSCLVKEGALVNEPCSAEKYKKWTPVHLAAYYGNLEWVRLFVQFGASIHALTADQLCPLWLAVRRGHFGVIAYLLEHRADVHCRTTSRYHKNDTPIHLAIQNRRLDIVKLLIQYKADVNFENDNDLSPLAVAIRENDYEIAKYLLRKGAKIYSETRQTTPLLNIAVALNQKPLVQLLLQHGADVDDVDKQGKTPLAVAIERGHEKMVKYLLKHGADPNVGYRLNGEIVVRSLFLAISGRNEKIVKELLKYPVDINVQMNNDKYTPLLMAVILGYAEIAEMLLNVKNVELDVVDVNGMSALHQAVANGHKDLIELMIEFGASVEVADKNGFTPLDYCKDGTVHKLHQLYSAKEFCLKLSDKELVSYIADEVTDSALIDLIDLCVNELARLKKKSVVGITLYELLTMSEQDCKTFFTEITDSQIKELSRCLRSDKVKAAFPNFVYMLRRKMLLCK